MKLLDEAFRITFDDMNADVRVSDVPVILMSKKTFGMEALRCDEVSCEAKGSDHCEFLMKPMFW